MQLNLSMKEHLIFISLSMIQAVLCLLQDISHEGKKKNQERRKSLNHIKIQYIQRKKEEKKVFFGNACLLGHT